MQRPKGAPEGVIGTRPHAMTRRFKHWLFCVHCGFVLLKNEASRKKMKEGCWVWADEQP